MASYANATPAELGFRPPFQMGSGPLEFQLLGMHAADDDFAGQRIDVPPRTDRDAYARFAAHGNWNAVDSGGGGRFSPGSAPRALVFLFGRTAAGVGVCARVRGFKPWAWFETDSTTAGRPWSRSETEAYLMSVAKAQRVSRFTATGSPSVSFRLERRRRFFGYEHDPATGDAKLRQHVRIATTSFRDLARMRRGIEHEGGTYRGKMTKLPPCLSSIAPPRPFGRPWTPQTQRRRPDIDMPAEFAAVLELGLLPGGWIRLRDGAYRAPSECYSHCDVEVECGAPAVEVLAENDWPAVDAPSSLLSFDIETYSSEGFPRPDRPADAIMGIGCVVQWRGDVCGTPDAPPHARTRKIYIANTDGGRARPGRLDHADEEIWECANELDVLRRFWRLAVVDLDADYVSGYNTAGFDWPYVCKRAALLTARRAELDALDATAPWSRGGGFMLRMSKLASLRTDLMVRSADNTCVPRRLLRGEFDLMAFVRKRHKFRCLKLDYIGRELVGAGKTGVTPADMNEAWQTGDPTKLAAVAHYCIVDCELVAEIERYDMCTDESRAFARVNRALLPFEVLTAGPVVRTTRALARFGLERGFMLGAYTPFTDQFTYEGGLVVQPQPGLYRCPVMVLDFKSLYPSIIRADRLCASTIVDGGVDAARAAGLSDDHLHVLDVAPGRRTCFRKGAGGLLPMLVEAFNDARDRTKKAQKGVDPASTRGKQLNMKQLQEKLAANSAYGVMKQLAIHVAEAITFTGREMLKLTQRRALELVPEARIVAGDTDSIMVAFDLAWTAADIDEAFRTGDRVAAEITKEFAPPKELENEGGYCPYYVDKAKKHYVCKQWLWSFATKRAVPQPEIAAKGMDFVRREAPSIFRNTDREFFTQLIMRDDEASAHGILEALVRRIFDPATPPTEFDFSTSMKALAEYKTDKLPQVVCYRQMERRQPGTGPRAGERLQYVVVENPHSRQLYDKYEDLEYAIAHPTLAKIDRRWYLERYIEHAKKAFAGLPKARGILRGALLRKQGIRTLDSFFRSAVAGKRPRAIATATMGDMASKPTSAAPPSNRPAAATERRRPSAAPPPSKRICLRTLAGMRSGDRDRVVSVASVARKK